MFFFSSRSEEKIEKTYLGKKIRCEAGLSRSFSPMKNQLSIHKHIIINKKKSLIKKTQAWMFRIIGTRKKNKKKDKLEDCFFHNILVLSKSIKNKTIKRTFV